MSDQEASQIESPPTPDLPDPAREALDEPHLSADDLKSEIGNSDTWDEASRKTESDAPEDGNRPADRSDV